MMRTQCAMIVGVLWFGGCLAENPEFLGVGFFDEVDADGPIHPVWNAPAPTSWWQRGECSPERGADGNWRFGTPGACDSGPQPGVATGASNGAVMLSTRSIPVEGRVTLAFATRVSLPACGMFALAGGRINAIADDVSQSLEFEFGQRASLVGASPLFSGEIDWTEVETTFEPAGSAVAIVFGFMAPPAGCLLPAEADDPCVPDPAAPAECAMVLACCDAAYADGSIYSGWQIDDVRLTVEP